MNWFEKHLGDWAKNTAHLSMLEEGAYNRLIDWCYTRERPLPILMVDVYRIARCVDLKERKAVQRVLEEFFELRDDGWHNSRVDKELDRYATKRPLSMFSKENAALRKSRHNLRRSELFAMLSSAGISAPWNASISTLHALASQHGLQPGTAPGTASTDGARNGSKHAASDAVGNDSLYPLPTSAVPGSDEPVTAQRAGARDAIALATTAGKACLAMRKAGLMETNPSDPRLLALLDAGATSDELRTVAAEAAARGKGWAWTLATVKGRRQDAQNGPTSRERNPAEGWVNPAVLKRN